MGTLSRSVSAARRCASAGESTSESGADHRNVWDSGTAAGTGSDSGDSGTAAVPSPDNSGYDPGTATSPDAIRQPPRKPSPQ